MRKILTMGAAGNSPWFPLDYWQKPFLVSVAGIISSGAVLTYTVQHTYDNPQDVRPVTSITRAGTVATVVDPLHRLSVGDSLNVMNTGDPNLDGVYDVATVVDQNSYTYNVANTGILVPVTPWNVRLLSLRVFPSGNAALVGASTRKEGSYIQPVQAVRLIVPTYTSGQVDLEIIQGAK